MGIWAFCLHNSAQLAHKARVLSCHHLRTEEELRVVAGAEEDHPGASYANSIRLIKHYRAALHRMEIKIAT